MEDPAPAPTILAKFEKHFPKLRTEPNTIIFKEGESGDAAYIVAQGEVMICTENAKGGLVHLATVKPGQFFGELALLNQRHRTATAVTKQGCELLVVHPDRVNALLTAADPFLRYWIEHLAARVLDLSKRAD